ncbi:KAP family NTPase [Gammaproteobacteria bacterium]|nr:KAP family NTPase [Gammaproteobacteria bacterium]
MVGIVDEALGKGGDDALKISSYKDALTDFIKRTDTPMTIGVQGQWGSGKTSLLNQIWNDLDKFNREDDSIDDFKQIWINSWEHSLLCSPEECLMKIINEIILDLLGADADKNKADKIKSSVNNIMKGALRIGSSMTLGTAGVNAVDGIFSQDSNSIKELREQLRSLVSEIKKLETNRYGKVVIYVDDLDRIDPKDAVSILELLKNVFNIKDCVFVLAIDYNVVVKGLEGKFGKPTPENEWEFRAFFDKIIQLPFTMPMGNYDIANYVLGLLGVIGFYAGKEELDPELINEFVTKSIGGNPRSIKRLINSLALIKILNDKDAGEGSDGVLRDKDTAMVMFAMVCLQVAHPEIYQLFVDEPDYRKWDKDLAYKETQGREEEDEKGEKSKSWDKNFEQAKATEDFNEPWEECLFRVCYVNPRRRKKATDISQFISLFDKKFEKKTVIQLIETSLRQTAVTSVSSKENPNVRPPKGSYQRFYVTGYDAWLENKIDRKDMNKKYPDFPFKETEDVVKRYIDFAKSNPYNAVDFDQSKQMDEQGSDYVLKYTRGISLYYRKKKIGSINIKRTGNGEFIEIQASKHPKYDNAPLVLTKSGIEFNHRRKIRGVDEDNKEVQGAWGFVDFMETLFSAKEKTLNNDVLKLLIDESSEARSNPDIFKDLISEKEIQNHVESFKTKRKDSNDYKRALNFLRTYFDDSNKKSIDL